MLLTTRAEIYHEHIFVCLNSFQDYFIIISCGYFCDALGKHICPLFVVDTTGNLYYVNVSVARLFLDCRLFALLA